MNNKIIDTSLMQVPEESVSVQNHNKNKHEEKFKLSEKIELDMMVRIAKAYDGSYRDFFKHINKIIKEYPTMDINKYLRDWINKYCKEEHIENHYKYMLEFYDTKHSKTNLPFDEDLIKPFFNCYKKLDENNKVSFNFEIPIGKDENDDVIWETLYTSTRVKEKNAWRDFIKNWWHSNENHDKRIECYMDVYNAIIEMENNPEIINNLNNNDDKE